MELNNNTKKYLTYGLGLFGLGLLLKNLTKRAGDQSQSDQEPAYIKPSKPKNTMPDGGIIGGAQSGIKAGIGKPEKNIDDLDVKIKKGSKSNTVKKLQYIINDIQSIRGQRVADDPGSNNKVFFPISTDGIFGNETAAAARVAFGNTYQRNGYITVRKAREQLARTAGYYKKPFPSNLVGVSNESDLHKIYNANIAAEQDDQSAASWFNNPTFYNP